MAEPLVSVIIVTYNSRPHLRDCLEALRASTYRNFEVVVVDNASRDDSVDFLRRDYPECRIIELARNVGFAEANNRAANVAAGQYLFLVNPDAAVEAGAMAALVAAAEADPRAAIWQPKMRMFHERRVLNSTGLRINRILYGCDRGAFELDRGQYDDARDIPAATGGAMLVRRAVFARLRGFDPRYFMYYEDLDLGLRARQAGWEVRYVPPAVVYHKLKALRGPYEDEYVDTRNRVRTMLKDLSAITLLWMLPVSLAFDMRAVISHLRGRRRRRALYRTLGWAWNLLKLPNTLPRRWRVMWGRRGSELRLLRMLMREYGHPQLPTPVPEYEPRRPETLEEGGMAHRVEMTGSETGQLGYGWLPVRSVAGRLGRKTGSFAVVFLRSLPRFVEPASQLEIDLLARTDAPWHIYLNDRLAGEFRPRPGIWQTVTADVLDGEPTQKVTLVGQGGPGQEGLWVSGLRCVPRRRPALLGRRPPRLLYVVHGFPPEESAGAELHTFYLAREMARAHPTFVFSRQFAPGRPQYETATEELAGIEVTRLVNNGAKMGLADFIDPEVEVHFRRHLERVQPDVVHFQHCFLLSASLIEAAANMGLTTVLTLHDYWFLCYRVQMMKPDGRLCAGPSEGVECNLSAGRPAADSAGPVRLHYMRHLFSRADAVLAPSQYLRNVYVREGFPADKIRFLPLGLDTAPYAGLRSRPHDKFRFAYIGTINPHKGLHVLIEAFNGLGPEAELQVWGMSGKPEYLEQVKAQAAHPGIEFRGPYANDALPRILSEVDVVVTPSIWHENHPLTVREAFMAHVPVIASNMGGYPEAVREGVNGFLFPAGNAAALRERMQAFLDDPELVNRLRANIEPVKDIREYAAEMEQLYGSLLRQRETAG